MDMIEIIARYESFRREYREAEAEARACGQEFPPFDEWAGFTSAKAKAQDRWRELESRDELDLY